MPDNNTKLREELQRWRLGWATAVQRVDECLSYIAQDPDRIPKDCCHEEVKQRLEWVRDEVLVVHKPDPEGDFVRGWQEGMTGEAAFKRGLVDAIKAGATQSDEAVKDYEQRFAEVFGEQPKAQAMNKASAVVAHSVTKLAAQNDIPASFMASALMLGGASFAAACRVDEGAAVDLFRLAFRAHALFYETYQVSIGENN